MVASTALSDRIGSRTLSVAEVPGRFGRLNAGSGNAKRDWHLKNEHIGYAGGHYSAETFVGRRR
jgi:hypothetical protein